MHVAVGDVVGDHGVPAADVLVGERVDEREVVVREPAGAPVGVAAGLLEGLEGERVDGLVGLVRVFRGVLVAVLEGEGQDVHVAPEVVGPVFGVGQGEVEVLELGEGEEGGGLDDVDAERAEDGVVEVEGVLQGELAARVGLLDARVLDDEDLVGRPSGRDVADDGLEEDGPAAGEADEEGRREGEVIVAVEGGRFRDVPLGDRRRLRVLEEGEVILDGWRDVGRHWLVFGVLGWLVRLLRARLAEGVRDLGYRVLVDLAVCEEGEDEEERRQEADDSDDLSSARCGEQHGDERPA